MTRAEVDTFADRWAEAWNQRDLDAVLKHFHQDIVFTSPTALVVVGKPEVHGKQALREYWTSALDAITSLRFEVDYALWDLDRHELAIVYTSVIDGKTRRVSENLRFNEEGLVVAAEVFHGVSDLH